MNLLAADQRIERAFPRCSGSFAFPNRIEDNLVHRTDYPIRDSPDREPAAWLPCGFPVAHEIGEIRGGRLKVAEKTLRRRSIVDVQHQLAHRSHGERTRPGR